MPTRTEIVQLVNGQVKLKVGDDGLEMVLRAGGKEARIGMDFADVKTLAVALRQAIPKP